ncbi:hypothetical protein SAMN04487945_2719 [Halobacterium jilantaiense]|uniref:Uncharacterized protein n=1 Tax=Halobacterium jilantaiense TaxID=355548 RepID=A0A1I0QMT5_9EURY|nr:hypothetical protein SAMN04487945_2719 [Halobacterium jilantaiense]
MEPFELSLVSGRTWVTAPSLGLLSFVPSSLAAAAIVVLLL